MGKGEVIEVASGHLKIHDRVKKRRKCNFCGKSFPQLWLLQNNETPPFLCVKVVNWPLMTHTAVTTFNQARRFLRGDCYFFDKNGFWQRKMTHRLESYYLSAYVFTCWVYETLPSVGGSFGSAAVWCSPQNSSNSLTVQRQTTQSLFETWSEAS